MFAVRRLFVFLLVVSSLALLTACQEGSSSSAGSGSRALAKNFQWQPLFGDGANDGSHAIARVGDIEITARDLELYLDEMLPADQSKYVGPEGERLLLKHMIKVVFLVQGAVDKKLFNDQDVARTLISHRRRALQSAMLNYGLLRGRKPSEEELREFFKNNRRDFRMLAIINARHIECLTKDEADEAYERLVTGGRGNDWISVMVDFSVNEDSKAQEGSVGWFNKDGFIPFIRGSKNFTNAAYDLEIGLHPPFQIINRWHVVEIIKRNKERPMTFSEAKDKVKNAMMPAWQEAIVQDFMLEARKQTNVEMLGKFAPGKGMNVDELFARALAVSDVEHKIELLNLIYTDYPESHRADDALFMAASVSLNNWVDKRVAERYLRILLKEYPDSELAEDAQFLKDNLYNPEVLNPQSMEELRKSTQ